MSASTPHHSSTSAPAPARTLASASANTSSPGLGNAGIPAHPYPDCSLSDPRVEVPHDTGPGSCQSNADNYAAMQRPVNSNQASLSRWSNGTSDSRQRSMAAPAGHSQISKQQFTDQPASSAPFGTSMSAPSYNTGSRLANNQHRYSQGLPGPVGTSSSPAARFSGHGLQVPGECSMARKTGGYSRGLDVTPSHQESSHNFHSQPPTKRTSNGSTSPGHMSPYNNNGTEISLDPLKQNAIPSPLTVDGSLEMGHQNFTEPMDWSTFLTDDTIDPSGEFPGLEFDPEALSLSNYRTDSPDPRPPHGLGVRDYGLDIRRTPTKPVEVTSEQRGSQGMHLVSPMGHRSASTSSPITPRSMGPRHVDGHRDAQLDSEGARLHDGSALVAGAFARQARVPAVLPPVDPAGGMFGVAHKDVRTELVDRLYHADGSETIAIRAPAMVPMPRYQEGVLGGPALFLQRLASYTENLQTWSRLASTCTILMHLALQLDGAVPRYTVEARSICLRVNFAPTDGNYAKLDEITQEADRIINNQAVARFREVGGHAGGPADPRHEGRRGADAHVFGTPLEPGQSKRGGRGRGRGRGGSAVGRGGASRSRALQMEHDANGDAPAPPKQTPAKKRRAGGGTGPSDAPTPAPKKRAPRQAQAQAQATSAAPAAVPAAEGSHACPSGVSSPARVDEALQHGLAAPLP